MDKFKDIEHDDLIKRFVSIEFNSILEYYKNATDLNVYNVHKEEIQSWSKNYECYGRRVRVGNYHWSDAGEGKTC